MVLIDFFRGFFVALSSAIIITFVIFVFAPILPFNIFSGYLGLLFFLLVVGLSFIVYIVLPPESPTIEEESPSKSWTDYQFQDP